jgi:hypothetical protein
MKVYKIILLHQLKMVEPSFLNKILRKVSKKLTQNKANLANYISMTILYLEDDPAASL